ncbi:MAG TPA: hypothetical protein VNX18_23365 [Bryobacteraceae bacterium]|nr:hypothetical protein [Bryobacteraceae bacterium]
MALRRDLPITAHEPVTLTVLGDPPRREIEGSVIEISGSAVRLELPSELAAGSPVMVTGADILLLGEVSGSIATAHGFEVAVVVSQSLTALSELDRLNRALLGAERSPAVEHEYSLRKR